MRGNLIVYAGAAFLIVALIYLVSFPITAYTYFPENPANKPSDFDGFYCFQEVMPGKHSNWYASASWFANPVLWIGVLLLLFHRWRMATLAGFIALGLGLLIFLMPPILGHRIWSVPAYRIGYWLWLSSMGVLAIAGVIGFILSKRTRISPNKSADAIV